jgi:hypothetical protein
MMTAGGSRRSEHNLTEAGADQGGAAGCSSRVSFHALWKVQRRRQTGPREAACRNYRKKIIVAWSGGGTGNDHRRLERRGHRKRSSSLGAAGAQETIPEGIAQQANGFVSVVICQQMAHLGCTVVAGKGV